MSFISLLPFVIGMVTVLQSTLNKKISMSEGVASAVFINSTLILIISFVFFLLQKNSIISLPEGLRSESLFAFKKWWVIVPALCGFTIVMGFPLSLTRLEVAQVFVLAIAGQCVAGLLWDTLIDGHPFQALKTLGVFLTLIGALLVSWK